MATDLGVSATDPARSSQSDPARSSQSQGFSPKPVEIWAQDASVLGWTCGNLVAPAAEVALFLHELLVSRTVVSAKALKAMMDTVPLNVGWAKG